MTAAKTHVVNETGNRLVVVREAQIERTSATVRNIRDLAAWPDGARDQRMWALSVVLHAPGLRFKTDDNLDEKFDEAQRIVDWINGDAP